MKQFNNLTIPIIFFGSSKFVLPILEVLRKNFSLALVITTEKNLTDAVPAYCLKNKIPYLFVKQPARNASQSEAGGFNNLTIQQLEKLNATVGALADFGLIIPPTILNIFPKGILNVHPSLLPKYRGPTPVQATILNGDKTTGISIIKLDEEIDHGPILGQEKEGILDTDTAESLYKRLFAKGANLLLKVLPEYLNENLKPMAQNDQNATFTKPLTRQDGYVDTSTIKNQQSKIKLEQKIRAYFPWPGVWTRLHLGGGRLKQSGSHDSSEVKKNKEKIIKFLPQQKLQVEGKKPMSYQDFLNGYPNLKQIHTLLKNL